MTITVFYLQSVRWEMINNSQGDTSSDYFFLHSQWLVSIPLTTQTALDTLFWNVSFVSRVASLACPRNRPSLISISLSPYAGQGQV